MDVQLAMQWAFVGLIISLSVFTLSWAWWIVYDTVKAWNVADDK